MPRGQHPNSRKNLEANQHLSSEEVRKRGSKGGKKSGEVRRSLRSFVEIDNAETTDEERMTMLNNLKERAKSDDKAFQLYRDTIGLKPVEKIAIAEVDAETITEVEQLVTKLSKGD